MVKSGTHDEAQALIDETHSGTLKTLMRLFDETPKILAEINREMVIVLRNGSCLLGVTADAVESVEAIHAETVAAIQVPKRSPESNLVMQAARTTNWS